MMLTDERDVLTIHTFKRW